MTSTAKQIECVKPRWASRLSEVFSHKPDKKSTSGTLCAKAPQNKAFLPNPLSKKASPMQAPSAICVSESNTLQALLLSYNQQARFE